MTPAELYARGAPIVMIHPIEKGQLILTCKRQPSDIVSALGAAGIGAVPSSDSGITVFYDRSLRQKKFIATLAAVLRTAGFYPILPGRGNRTWSEI
jgi:hypothetical protein